MTKSVSTFFPPNVRLPAVENWRGQYKIDREEVVKNSVKELGRCIGFLIRLKNAVSLHRKSECDFVYRGWRAGPQRGLQTIARDSSTIRELSERREASWEFLEFPSGIRSTVASGYSEDERDLFRSSCAIA